MQTRPKFKPQLTQNDWILEIAGWLTLLALWIVTLWYYTELPVLIPIHFDLAGNINDEGSKITIFILPLFGSIIFTGMTLLNRYPHLFNYPVKVTVENAERLYTTASRLIRYLKFATVFIFTIISFLTVQNSMGRLEGLSVWIIPLMVVMIFVPLIIAIIKMFRK